ncbi:MAG: S-methyl-5-thioribose-1-phosphate isomerase [SAR86 cluster bacterium]
MSAVPMAVRWESGQLILLDQTQLPHAEVLFVCETIESVFTAITSLKVRGAPAIGIAAAYGLLVGLDVTDDLMARLKSRVDYLASARPTAVNLAWALSRMLNCALTSTGLSGSQLVQRLEREAIAIHAEDRLACQAIGAAGAPIVTQYPNVLTHCNAGALAVSALGTALAPIYVAAAQGVAVHVFVDETRPLLQGARLTAFELGRAGVRRTLITDNMAAHVMACGQVDMVLVGADRVAANGDTANKIGTLNLAILCAYYQIPFYVACPASTIDRQTPSGEQIPIEQRHADEVRYFGEYLVAEANTPVFNPAFDITPGELVTGIITDRGVMLPPYKSTLARAFPNGA